MLGTSYTIRTGLSAGLTGTIEEVGRERFHPYGQRLKVRITPNLAVYVYPDEDKTPNRGEKR